MSSILERLDQLEQAVRGFSQTEWHASLAPVLRRELAALEREADQ